MEQSGTIQAQQYCKTCLKAGCQACRALEGSEECAFCEDGELCPTRQRIAERAKLANISQRAFKTQTKSVKKEKENTMDVRLCKCGCGEPAGAKWEYKRGHKPKDEKKSGGANSTPSSPEKAHVVKPHKAAGKKPTGTAANPSNDGVATIRVTESALDRWWSAQSVEQKATSFTHAMAAGQ